jgi:hypothetical protein
MGRLIRENGFSTEVESGTYCASCRPLVFARGVHQVRPLRSIVRWHGRGAAQSAICQKYLRDMGVDLAVWVQAMETPKERLYYFKGDELMALKLASRRAAGRSPRRRSCPIRNCRQSAGFNVISRSLADSDPCAA